jgi:hypothetical protein
VFTLFFILILNNVDSIYLTHPKDNFDQDKIKLKSFEERLNVNLTLGSRAFTENKGQLENHKIRFYVQNMGMWFTDDGAILEIKDYMKNKNCEEIDSHKNYDINSFPINKVLLKQIFIGANNVEPEGKNSLNYSSNFFHGNDSSKWIIEVPNFQEIYYRNIYNKIDLRYQLYNKGLKYDLILHPGANLKDIRIRYDGIERLCLKDNNLMLKTKIYDIAEGNLFVYQGQLDQKVKFNSKYKIFNDCEFGFEILNDYNKDGVLTIDPLIFLEFSTFYGGTNNDYGSDIDVDKNNNVYVTGYSESSDLPTTKNANDTSYNGDLDCFVFKLNQDGSSMLYSTYIGGNADDYAIGLDIDDNGNAYITGRTYSLNFPSTQNANDTTYNGAYDCFVVKINSIGSRLVYSTYIGGSSDDKGEGIVLDTKGNAYVVGYTKSTDFPITPGAHDNSFNGAGDIFSFKLNSSGSILVYSTYIGGTDGDVAHDIGIDPFGNAYIIGWTYSTDFPKSSGVYDPTHNGETDCIIFKLNQSGNKLDYSTFVGGTSFDYGYGIDVDTIGNAYVTGYTLSSNFPTTNNSLNQSFNGGSTDIFCAKINKTGSNLLFSTYLGGAGNDYGRDISIDSNGNSFVTGYSSSSDFYITRDAFDNTTNKTEGIIFKLSQNGSNLVYSSFLGGDDNEESRGICLDSTGNVFLTGITYSNNFPITNGVFDNVSNGNVDAFVLKISFQPYHRILSCSLFERNNETNLIFTKYCPYSFKIDVMNSKSIFDIKELQLNLEPDDENIQLNWDSITNQFSELSDPNDFINLDSSSSITTNSLYTSTIFFNVTFNWNYPDEDLSVAQISMISKSMTPTRINEYEVYRIENDLVFNGSLIVQDENDQVIENNTIVRGWEKLTWSGLIPTYENYSNKYPPSNEYSVAIWNESGFVDFDNPVEGESTNKIGLEYKINYTKIPIECDKTNSRFFVRIDGDNVTFVNNSPTNDSWQNSKELLAGVSIKDVGGAIVNGSSIKRSISKDNGSTWANWKHINNILSNNPINVNDMVFLDNGINNLIRWQAKDSVGNGPTISQEFRIKVDTEPVSFSNAKPTINNISSTEEVQTGIKIIDSLSGVNASSVQYSISVDDGATWKQWEFVNNYINGNEINVLINLTFVNGTGNRLKWRAWDLAGNGPTESDQYIIIVNTWTPPIKPKVSLLSPPNGMSLNRSSIQLSWELENKTFNGVIFDLYFENVTPPHIHEKDIDALNYTIDNLMDGENYYWRVIPKLNGVEGTCLSGIYWFKVELPFEQKTYALALTGPNDISMYPGENKTTELTVTNIGSHEDIIKLDLQAGILAAYIQIDDYSMLTLAKNSNGKRSLKISLPKSVQPGNHTITVTAISMNSGELVKVAHEIRFEIKKPDYPGNGKKPNGTEPNGTPTEPGEESDDMFLYGIIGIIIAMVVCLVVIGIVIKRKKRMAPETLPSDSITTKPQPLTVVNIGESPPPKKPFAQPQIPPPSTPQTELPQPQQQATPTIAQPESTSTITANIGQTPTVAMSSVAQTPQLPPASEHTQPSESNPEPTNSYQETIQQQDLTTPKITQQPLNQLSKIHKQVQRPTTTQPPQSTNLSPLTSNLPHKTTQPQPQLKAPQLVDSKPKV